MTTHIWSVTPIHVGRDELERRQQRYARITGPGVQVHLHDIGPDAPSRLENERDVHDSESAVCAAFDEQRQEWDYLLPDCVLDPGVPEGDQIAASRRRLGMLELVTADLHAHGRRFGAVARNSAIATELHRKVRAYGFGDACAGVRELSLGVDSIAEGDRWSAAMRGAVDEFANQGVTAVINGCSAVEMSDPVRDDILVIDPAETALRLLALRVRR